MTPKHFLQLSDFDRGELDYLFERTRWIKERFKRYEIYQPLRDRTLAMVFEKASTRTRVSFEAGMNQLGGIAINLNRGDTQLSRGEPIEDLARVISRMVDVVMIRTFEQSIIERFAANSRVPVINGHTESVSVELGKNTERDDLLAAFSIFSGEPQKLRLPSAPARPIVYMDAPDRPQPRLDAERGGGMAVYVGRLRYCHVLSYKFVVLGHNTIRGAAGAALLNAELMVAKKLVD